jgi:hypothetical protein
LLPLAAAVFAFAPHLQIKFSLDFGPALGEPLAGKLLILIFSKAKTSAKQCSCQLNV